ncbi:MAG: TIGR01777 family oxidoreductase [Deltaproteobacteria bacterium]
MRALVTGATGFIGRKLVSRIEHPMVLSRRPEAARKIFPGAQVFAWEPETGPPPSEAMEGVEVVFNLAGESVAGGRWTRDRKERIRRSRVEGTRNLVRGLEALKKRPRALVSASAVGYYGSRGDVVLTETAKPGDDFLAEVCVAWEAEANQAASLGLRVVTPRVGVVLGRDGGALARMLPPFKLGLGGRLASGRHWMPWIHLDDLVEILLFAGKFKISGAINAVAPTPVMNSEFTRALAATLQKPAIFPVPEFALRVMFGELASVLLASQRVVPEVAIKSGIRFKYASLRDALRVILEK